MYEEELEWEFKLLTTYFLFIIALTIIVFI